MMGSTEIKGTVTNSTYNNSTEKSWTPRTSNDSTDSNAAWTLRPEQALKYYETSEDGLNQAECDKRLSQYGKNALQEGGGVSAYHVMLRQLCNSMMLVLLIAMAISFGIKDFIVGGVVGFVFALNVVVGFFQEYAAEQTMDSLRKLGSPTARVIRAGNESTIPAGDLVPGDIVAVNVGDTIPADCRIISCMNFETDEALLTGESLPIAKESAMVCELNSPVGDRINMIYSSSVVSKGRARAVVSSTGMNTEIGKIAASLAGDDSKFRQVNRDEEGNARKRDYMAAFLGTVKDLVGAFLGTTKGTPLHRALSKFSILLFFIAVVLAIIAMAAQKFDVNREVAVYAIALALAMIPASLVLVLTVTMAVGAKAMADRNVIVRKLNSLEALGSVNDICSDKTGTLTQGKMIVKKVWVPSAGTYHVDAIEPFNPTQGSITHCDLAPAEDDEPVFGQLPEHSTPFSQFLDIASLANIANVKQVTDDETGEVAWTANGDPTEIAVQVFVHRLGWQRSKWVDGDSPVFTHLAEYPFDSSIKRMSTVYQHTESERITVFTKGAAERIIGCCSHWWKDGKVVEFGKQDQERVQENVEALTKLGLRVLGFARKDDLESQDFKTVDRSELEQNLVFHGLVGIYDPPRPESAGAVKQCHQAGINVHMLTGDHQGTAKAIAQEVGILPRNLYHYAEDVIKAMVMTATEFDAMSDDEIDKLPVLPLVIARCAPQTKVRMIDALHRRSAFCAMTGDGVNDSPSLKKADIGIAMGSGSDVAKNASDNGIILSDDNFASILNGIEEGRRLTSNIQKFVCHLVAGNVSQVLYLLLGLAFKDETGLSVFPLSAIEVLWLIVITSSFPAVGLGCSPVEADALKRNPKSPKEAVFSWELVVDTIYYGLILGVICIVTFVGLVYGDGNGELGRDCNENYSERCLYVYRARSTTFVQMTWCLLILAWELIDMRRSMFAMKPESEHPWTQFFRDVWQNQLLFWSVIAGAVICAPLIYIPVINYKVFRHGPISWEWGVAVGAAVVYVLCCELYKWGKRAYYRRFSQEAHNPECDLGGKPFEKYRTLSRSNTMDV